MSVHTINRYVRYSFRTKVNFPPVHVVLDCYKPLIKEVIEDFVFSTVVVTFVTQRSRSVRCAVTRHEALLVATGARVFAWTAQTRVE